MAVAAAQVQITSPCPITLDRSGAGPRDRALHCGHCDKQVHLLSHMTEAEARAFMAAQAGADICVSYAIGRDGAIRFRPEPALVPASALTRPSRVQRSLVMAASIGAAALLGACTPHGIEGGLPVEAQPRTTPVVEVQRPDRDFEVAGGMVAEPIEEQPCDPEPQAEPEPEQFVDGGLKARPIAEPPPEVQQVAGGLRPRPLPDAG